MAEEASPIGTTHDGIGQFGPQLGALSQRFHRIRNHMGTLTKVGLGLAIYETILIGQEPLTGIKLDKNFILITAVIPALIYIAAFVRERRALNLFENELKLLKENIATAASHLTIQRTDLELKINEVILDKDWPALPKN